jgi:hypothetical protein
MGQKTSGDQLKQIRDVLLGAYDEDALTIPRQPSPEFTCSPAATDTS